MPTITLTDAQYQKILADFHATKEKRTRLSQTEVVAIANSLNSKINIPIFFSEHQEQKILIKIVVKVDSFLYDNLPNEVYDLIRSLPEGVDDAEARRIVSTVSKLANKRIDLPYLPEVAEYVAISFVISVIVNAMRQHWDLHKALDAFEQIEQPDSIDRGWNFPSD